MSRPPFVLREARRVRERSRYRSLGCAPCTSPNASEARKVEEIVAELTTGKLAHIAERSGRTQDPGPGSFGRASPAPGAREMNEELHELFWRHHHEPMHWFGYQRCGGPAAGATCPPSVT